MLLSNQNIGHIPVLVVIDCIAFTQIIAHIRTAYILNIYYYIPVVGISSLWYSFRVSALVYLQLF